MDRYNGIMIPHEKLDQLERAWLQGYCDRLNHRGDAPTYEDLGEQQAYYQGWNDDALTVSWYPDGRDEP